MGTELYRFTTRLAGLNIEINSLHTRVMAMNRRFIVEQEPDIKLISTQAEIDIEKERYIKSNGYRNDPWDGFIELSSVLKSLCNEFVDHDIFMMHGAVIENDGSAYMFTAPSGTGKTTHILKWSDRLPDAVVVNGDKPFIRFPEDGSQPLACGSPWAGKENLYSNTMAPLKAIVLLERAENNHINQITFAEALPKLLQQVYFPDDTEKKRKVLRLMTNLNGSVSFWRFQCNNFKEDSFDVAYNALVRDQQ